MGAENKRVKSEHPSTFIRCIPDGGNESKGLVSLKASLQQAGNEARRVVWAVMFQVHAPIGVHHYPHVITATCVSGRSRKEKGGNERHGMGCV